MKRMTIFGMVLVLGFAGCDSAKSRPAASSKPNPEQAAADPTAEAQHAKNEVDASDVTLQIKDYDGIVELIARHQGKVVVVDCWSTWCDPCMKEFPGLVALHEKYGPEKVACISLSLDFDGLPKTKPEDSEAKVLKFLRSQGAAFDNVLSSTPADDLTMQLKFAAPPTVFVYDQQGELARKFEGGEEAQYEAKIAPFVEQLVEGEAE
jgi:thiol-disulfide isomerase/thioredoxin